MIWDFFIMGCCIEAYAFFILYVKFDVEKKLKEQGYEELFKELKRHR
jgi:hypothetical protein